MRGALRRDTPGRRRRYPRNIHGSRNQLDGLHPIVDTGSCVSYKRHMVKTQRTAEFADWFANLRDARARQKIAIRIARLEAGNRGDHKRFDGLLELRLDHGPGYRLYCWERGTELVILLCGGDKGSQRRDIERAKRIMRMNE